MKKYLKTVLLSVLTLCTLCIGAQATENSMLKVGLKYGSNALFTARLQNYNETLSGSGYELGYYEQDRSFVRLAATDAQKITITVDSNAYVSGDVCYEAKPANYSTVLGAYHIELLTAFGSYEEALAVAQGYDKGFVAYIDGEYRVRIGNHAGYDESALVLSQTDVLSYGAQIVSPSRTGVVVSATGTDTILFEFDCSGLRSLGVKPLSVSGEKTVTWFAGNRYYGGFEYQRTTGGHISVINVVDMEDYVKCVIAAEMANDWPLEALKAQTVCARGCANAPPQRGLRRVLDGGLSGVRRNGAVQREVRRGGGGDARGVPLLQRRAGHGRGVLLLQRRRERELQERLGDGGPLFAGEDGPV